MKRFFQKEVEKMFRGVSFVGFPLDGLVVFINSICSVVGRRVLLVAPTTEQRFYLSPTEHSVMDWYLISSVPARLVPVPGKRLVIRDKNCGHSGSL